MKDIKELTGKLNKFRIENTDRIFTSEQLINDLKELGFNKHIAIAICSILPKEKVGRNKLYQFPKTPIHVSEVQALFNRMNSYNKKHYEKVSGKISSNNDSIDVALATVQAAGFRVSKPVFDFERFKREQPEMLALYTRYEVIQ